MDVNKYIEHHRRIVPSVFVKNHSEDFDALSLAAYNKEITVRAAFNFLKEYCGYTGSESQLSKLIRDRGYELACKEEQRTSSRKQRTKRSTE